MPATRSARRAERNTGVRSGILMCNPEQLGEENTRTTGIPENSAAAGEAISRPPPSSSDSASISSLLREVRTTLNEFKTGQQATEERIEARFETLFLRQREEMRHRSNELQQEIRATEQRFERQLSALSTAPFPSALSPNARPVPPLLPLSGDAPISTSASRISSIPRCKDTPKFNGNNWEAFKMQFLALARVNGWDDTVKISLLLNSLTDNALSILPSLSETQCSDFNALFKALEHRFGRLRSRQLNVVEFNNYTQVPGQSVQALAFEIERLVNLAYPDISEEMKDDLVTARFLASLTDVELKRQLLLANVSGLQQTLSKAVEIELINKTFRAPPSTSVSASVSFSPSPSSSRKRTFAQSTLNSDKRKIICYECGKPGHTKARCFTLHPELKKFRSGESDRNIKRKISRVQGRIDDNSGNEEGRN